VTPLLWLAIPMVTTLLAIVIVPAVARHRRRKLSAAARAERMRRALAPRTANGRRGSLE
jgi:cytochrome c-type biogenesis protein CcmH/NrfF